MQSTDNLFVAQYARKLVVLTYRTTVRFPRAELFGLTSQMRRAAIAIGSNIAEGCGRSTKKQFIHSLDQAAGEASELEYQCLVAADLTYGRPDELDVLRTETVRVKKMLSRLMAYHRNQPQQRKGETRPASLPSQKPTNQQTDPNNRTTE